MDIYIDFLDKMILKSQIGTFKLELKVRALQIKLGLVYFGHYTLKQIAFHFLTFK